MQCSPFCTNEMEADRLGRVSSAVLAGLGGYL